MGHVRWQSVAFEAIGLALVATLLVGCGPMSQQLRQLIDSGNHQAALSKGEQYLHDYGHKRDGDAELTRVEGLVAEAALKIAKQADTASAYAKMRKAIPLTKASQAQHLEAYELEARAWLRDFAITSNTLPAYRAFRKRYPKTKAARRARGLELRLAYESASSQGTMKALDRFIVQYRLWPEAKPWIAQAQEAEAKTGYRQALVTRSVEVWRRFCDRFAGTQWSKRGRKHEVVLAWTHAQQYSDVEKVLAFIARYEHQQDVDPRIVSQARTRAAGLAWQSSGTRQDEAGVRVFIRRFESWPEAASVVAKATTRLAALRLTAAQTQGSVQALDNWLQLHRQWPEAAGLVRQARRLLVKISFTQAKSKGGRGPLQDFIDRFRDWPEAAELRVVATRLLLDL
ncbi:MAG TPA: hypothetical protein DCQ06_09305 [Myxococcales bacterium]|nr:hypothetical protein [Myxococcales bacterium]